MQMIMIVRRDTFPVSGFSKRFRLGVLKTTRLLIIYTYMFSELNVDLCRGFG